MHLLIMTSTFFKGNFAIMVVCMHVTSPQDAKKKVCISCLTANLHIISCCLYFSGYLLH